MAAKVKIRGKLKDGVAQVKSLMPHPMETGTQRDPDGNLIAAHYIDKVKDPQVRRFFAKRSISPSKRTPQYREQAMERVWEGVFTDQGGRIWSENELL